MAPAHYCCALARNPDVVIGGGAGVGASVEEELGGVGEGDIYDAGGGGEGAEMRVDSGAEDVGCVCCIGWEEEGGFLG